MQIFKTNRTSRKAMSHMLQQYHIDFACTRLWVQSQGRVFLYSGNQLFSVCKFSPAIITCRPARAAETNCRNSVTSKQMIVFVCQWILSVVREFNFMYAGLLFAAGKPFCEQWICTLQEFGFCCRRGCVWHGSAQEPRQHMTEMLCRLKRANMHPRTQRNVQRPAPKSF